MIPKILHFGCFGGHKLSDINHRCIESWRRVLPDYELRFWNDENGPKNPWFQRAVKECPVNAHNYMEQWVLFKHGGVMLDNDVEMVRPFDLSHRMFIGFQQAKSALNAVNCAVMGAEPRHPLIYRVLHAIERFSPTHDPVEIGCGVMTQALYGAGMKGVNVEQMVGDVQVYDKERFAPYFHDECPIPASQVTERTFCIHLYEGSWARKKAIA